MNTAKSPSKSRVLPKVGDTVYLFNENRRVYRKDESGKSFGSPIYREHFLPIRVTGENARVLFLNDHTTFVINKKSGLARVGGYQTEPFFTQKEMEDACFIKENSIVVSEQIRKLWNDNRGAEKLMKIMAILFPE